MLIDALSLYVAIFQTNARLVDIEKEYSARSQRSNDVSTSHPPVRFA